MAISGGVAGATCDVSLEGTSMGPSPIKWDYESAVGALLVAVISFGVLLTVIGLIDVSHFYEGL